LAFLGPFFAVFAMEKVPQVQRGDQRTEWGAALVTPAMASGKAEGRQVRTYFFLPATVLRAPRRVRALVRVRCPRTGKPMR